MSLELDSNVSALEVDAKGRLYAAINGKVVILDPREGKRLVEISLPETQIKQLILGGPEQTYLYISTGISVYALELHCSRCDSI